MWGYKGFFYVGLLGYVFWFIDDFMIIMSSTILGVILIYLSGMIITIQKNLLHNIIMVKNWLGICCYILLSQ